MNQAAEVLTVERAEEEVRRSNLEFEGALNQFRDKLEVGVRGIERYVEAAKNPFAMVAIVFTVGIFFGQLIRFSFKNRSR